MAYPRSLASADEPPCSENADRRRSDDDARTGGQPPARYRGRTGAAPPNRERGVMPQRRASEQTDSSRPQWRKSVSHRNAREKNHLTNKSKYARLVEESETNKLTRETKRGGEMTALDKHLALGRVAELTLQMQEIERDRDLAAKAAAAHGATASELAAVLKTSRATAHRHYHT